jgi:hypothetical protein
MTRIDIVNDKATNKKHCDTCIYYEGLSDEESKYERRGNGWGKCHRYPPSVSELYVFTYNNEKHNSPISKFTRVKCDETWCGEYKHD